MALLSCGKVPNSFHLESPDGQIELGISLVDNKLHYQIDRNDLEVLRISELEIFPGAEVLILNSTERENDTTWNPVWGQFSTIRDHYRELVLDIVSNQVKGRLFARVYDDGVAFRIVLEQGSK